MGQPVQLLMDDFAEWYSHPARGDEIESARQAAEQQAPGASAKAQGAIFARIVMGIAWRAALDSRLAPDDGARGESRSH
jgi:hypothetical protein